MIQEAGMQLGIPHDMFRFKGGGVAIRDSNIHGANLEGIFPITTSSYT